MDLFVVKIIFLTTLLRVSHCDECTKLDILAASNVENEGFHRDIKWLIELNEDNLTALEESGCNLALRQDIPEGIFVNPDQIQDLVRVGKVSVIVDGKVDVEAPMHLATPHVVYIYNNDMLQDRIQFILPVHLRYQRAQLTGGFGKVKLPRSTLLLKCEKDFLPCGKRLKVDAPCSYANRETCVWYNTSYQQVTNEIELLVPIGDLDHYPLVSIVTLLVSCAGCIYILSILSMTVL